MNELPVPKIHRQTPLLFPQLRLDNSAGVASRETELLLAGYSKAREMDSQQREGGIKRNSR